MVICYEIKTSLSIFSQEWSYEVSQINQQKRYRKCVSADTIDNVNFFISFLMSIHLSCNFFAFLKYRLVMNFFVGLLKMRKLKLILTRITQYLVLPSTFAFVFLVLFVIVLDTLITLFSFCILLSLLVVGLLTFSFFYIFTLF